MRFILYYSRLFVTLDKFLAKLSVTSAESSVSAIKINAIYFVLLSTFRNFVPDFVNI